MCFKKRDFIVLLWASQVLDTARSELQQNGPFHVNIAEYRKRGGRRAGTSGEKLFVGWLMLKIISIPC